MVASVEGGEAITVTLQSDMTVESDDLVNVQMNTTTAPNGMDVLVLTATTATAESGADAVVDVAVVTSYLEPGAATELTFNGAERKTFLTAVRTGVDSESPLEDALADFVAAAEVDSDELRTTHEEAWRELTGESGVEIVGRHDVAVAVNASYYYLLSSVREDAPRGLSPGGLASNGYNGHSFWVRSAGHQHRSETLNLPEAEAKAKACQACPSLPRPEPTSGPKPGPQPHPQP